MKGMKLTEIEKMAENDLKLRIDRTEVDSANTPSLFNKYHKELRLCEQELIETAIRLKKIWKEKWYYYSGKCDPDVYKEKPLNIKILKTDIKMHIEADDDVLGLTFRLEMLEMKKKAIERIMKEINNRSFHITNIIKTLEFKNGNN